jgi:hypothetical protein
MATKSDVFDIAKQAVAQRKVGDTTWTHNGSKFDLNSGGYCARFVRQCYESAMGSGEFTWQFIAPTAREMEKKLAAAGLKTDSPEPGDIVCLNNQSYYAGHIAIYAGVINGVKSIFENTSSGKRGDPRNPGTKMSPFSAVQGELSGYYAVFEGDTSAHGYEAGPIKVEYEGTQVDAWFSDHGIVGVKNMATLLGFQVEDQVATNRKIVITK